MANEKRLIDANALIDWLTKPTGFRCNCEDCPDIDCLHCVIEDAIKNAPTVDAVEVVHASWIKDGDVVVCSNCGEEHAWDEYRATYCEDCGAKMDGERTTDG